MHPTARIKAAFPVLYWTCIALLTVPPLQVRESTRLAIPRCNIDDAPLVSGSEFGKHFMHQIHGLKLARVQKGATALKLTSMTFQNVSKDII